MRNARASASVHVALALAAILPAAAAAQTRITTPRQAFGHDFGNDYFLANYTQIADYWHTLDRESDRMVLREIGRTAGGRSHLMAIVTSPANHAMLEHYRDISSRLAHAEGQTEQQARALAREGKAVVWIDGGLHASESLGAQQLGEMVYQMVSRDDEETRRILDDVIILFVHANPDGNELVADWYMRRADPEQRSLSGLPELYQKYIGHDNNRDFFASTQAETENINRVLYHEWFPQLLYNHHQSGPAGTILWSPPLRDPYNFNLDPMLVLGFQSLGAAMHTRLALEGKPGATMRSGGPYDGWWNGGIRNTAAFHNVIALLTEMVGSPTPMRIPLVMQRQLPSADLAYPVPPQEWHFRQSIDYSVSLNRAVLDYASRMRENLLFGIWTMGHHSIERGSQDTWTANPKRYAEVATRMGESGGRGGRGGGASEDRDMQYWAELHTPELRDPRAFVIPSDQPDFPTAVKFINALRETGIAVQRATRDFEAAGKRYPAGSFVVFTAQAFRPHVMDMFEPQVHPDVFPIPGGPPTPPYDNAGWTLAFQMGVHFDRILEGFTGPFEPVTDWNVAPPPGRVTSAANAKGFLIGRRTLDSFVAINRLLKAKAEVYALASASAADGRAWPAGTFYVKAGGAASGAALEKIATDLGIDIAGTTAAVPAGATRMRTLRVGLWDQYGGSIDSGWARWILEQFEFPFERVYAQQLDAGKLNARYDALVFVDGAIPASDGGGRGGADPDDIPARYRAQTGRVSADRTIPQLRAFAEAGGTIIAIGGSATNLARHLALPIEDHLVENGQPLPRTKLYVPGSVLSARFDTTQSLTYGMEAHTDVFFDDSPVFRLGPSAASARVKRIGWFDSASPLRSGWAWGQPYLENGVVAAEVPLGKGSVILFGPEILKRAQPHGTFRLLFNALVTR